MLAHFYFKFILSNLGKSTIVKIWLNVRAIKTLDEIERSLTVTALLTRSWNDSRIAFRNDSKATRISRNSNFVQDCIWLPKLVFGKAIKSQELGDINGNVELYIDKLDNGIGGVILIELDTSMFIVHSLLVIHNKILLF